MSRKALGKGLSALIASGGDELGVSQGVSEIDIDRIEPNPEQPRNRFPKEELDELAQSIRANGIVQPIILRRKGEDFQIVAGERRWRAAQTAGLQKVPVIIREVSDDKLLEIALIENIQRQELNPVEEARAYDKLIANVGLTQAAVAGRVGKTRTFITNYLRLLKLPMDVLGLVEDGKLSVGHARALLGLEEDSQKRKLAKEIVGSSLSVRDTEKAVRLLIKGSSIPKSNDGAKAKKDPNIKKAETKLRRKFGTQVRIISGSERKKGRIELDYYGESELDRIYQLLITE